MAAAAESSDRRLRLADYEEPVQALTQAVSPRKPSRFFRRIGQGSRYRTYAKPRVGRWASAVAVGGLPDRTSEPGLNW